MIAASLTLVERLSKAYGFARGLRIAEKLCNSKVRQYQRTTSKGKVVTVHEHNTKAHAKEREDYLVGEATRHLGRAEEAHDLAVKDSNFDNHDEAHRGFNLAYRYLEAARKHAGGDAYKGSMEEISRYQDYHNIAAQATARDSIPNEPRAHRYAAELYEKAIKELSGKGLIGEKELLAHHKKALARHKKGAAEIYRKASEEAAAATHKAEKNPTFRGHKAAWDKHIAANEAAEDAGMGDEARMHLVIAKAHSQQAPKVRNHGN